ncbi:extracellular solute-binding protein [Candidatus Pelagadaptatus aseana]|uniref:extracellular solute-binding protein n=1 Tax=Candidatus Pelagadaptatus aseana TaxID=3120508 RepID=UPI003C6FD97F
MNIYSYRQAYLIEPVLEAFTAETGIKANIVYAKKGLVERLQREGEFSPADVVLATDISRVVEFSDKGLSQALSSDVINANIPAQYRDPENHWFALTLRVRNIYSAKTLGDLSGIAFEDLTDEKYKGQICTRSGKHPYNVALVASLIAHHGEAGAREWLQGVKANLARRPQGNDRAQVKAIKEGLCSVALGNSYYFGKMLNNEEQKPWADAVNINFPNQKDRGAHVNVSGMVLTKYAPNKTNAVRLMEYLSGDQAQEIYASVNMEYPVKPGVKNSELVDSWGTFEADDLALETIARNRPAALKLLDEVKFDL